MKLILALVAGAFFYTPSVSKAASVKSYPRWVERIPKQFGGGWDEEVRDGRADREARYHISSAAISEFEVLWHVQRVKLLSPTSFEASAVIDPSFAPPSKMVWRFDLVDSGKGLTEPGAHSVIYRRCPF
jgi:hypothetical protein